MGPYIDRCVPFQIMSNQLNLPQVDSKQVVETSQGDQWKQDAPELNFKYHSKGSEYLGKSGISFLVKISTNLFSLCHYGVLFVDR